jgi:hypothetical protein
VSMVSVAAAGKMTDCADTRVWRSAADMGCLRHLLLLRAELSFCCCMLTQYIQCNSD